MISVIAPFGTAVLGYEVDSEVESATPGGLRHLRIEAVEYQSEAAWWTAWAPPPRQPNLLTRTDQLPALMEEL